MPFTATGGVRSSNAPHEAANAAGDVGAVELGIVENAAADTEEAAAVGLDGNVSHALDSLLAGADGRGGGGGGWKSSDVADDDDAKSSKKKPSGLDGDVGGCGGGGGGCVVAKLLARDELPDDPFIES